MSNVYSELVPFVQPLHPCLREGVACGCIQFASGNKSSLAKVRSGY